MQLALWSAAFAVGIACGLALGSVACTIVGVLACSSCVTLASMRAWRLAVGLLCLVAGIGAGRWQVAVAGAAPAVVEDELVPVLGQVVRGSDVSESPTTAAAPEVGAEAADGPVRAHLRIAVREAKGKPLTARLSLTVLDGIPTAAPGDWVRFDTRLYVPRGFANPGLPDGRLLTLGQGIDLMACVRRPSDLRIVEGPVGPMAYARRLAFRLRRAMARIITSQLAEPVAGFVRTMVIGERTNVPTQIEDGFRAAGATHVLSVSGLHLAVIVALVFQALRWLAARFPAWALRCPPKVLASLVAVPVTVLYTLLTGEALATVRSAVMAIAVLGATLVNRPLSLAASIGAAALFLLVPTPAALLDVSFRLSFASVIGLALFARWLLPAGTRVPSSVWAKAGTWLARSLSASLAACLLTMPLVAHHFGEVTPAAPLGNLILVPIVEVVVLPLGLGGALLGLLHPWLAIAPLYVAGLASEVALGAADVFRAVAPVLLVRYPSATETALLTVSAAALLRGLGRGTSFRRWWLAGAGLAMVLAAGSLGARELARRSSHDLRVTFLDVGQGESVLIRGPGGFTALVDGGGRYDGRFDPGARIVEPVLRAAGISRLDLVVLSHAHPDHMNGLFRVLERFPVGALWTNGDDGHNPGFAKLLALARERGATVASPAPITRDGLSVEVWGPQFDGRVAVPPGLGTNDGSLVLRLVAGERSILLTGDIGEEGEAELLDARGSGSRMRSDVLKVPHHGSRHASGSEFVDAVSPTMAVVSAGQFNRFGLPSAAAVARYHERHVRLLRTDRDGAVTLTVAEGKLAAPTCERGCGE